MRSIRPFFTFIAVGLLFIFLNAFDRPPSRTGTMEEPSGLKPLFPSKIRCAEIASAYGSQTRYDGSRRPKFRFGGRHGGIDLSLAEGTPVLAIAEGTVVNKGEGERMEGIFLWLRHSPQDTGLSYWIYSKYQHLQSPPELQIGDTVIMGQVVAHSGKTGTVGGHYGTKGYPHLHLSILKATQGEYQTKDSRMLVPDSILIDPLTIYHEASSKFKSAVDMSSHKKTVIIPYIDTNGVIWPPGTRLVWPVTCQPR